MLLILFFLIGLDLGMLFACYGRLLQERDAIETGVIKLDDKYFYIKEKEVEDKNETKTN